MIMSPKHKQPASRSPWPLRDGIRTPADLSPLAEVRLRRLTIDEALPRLDQHLHDAFVAGLHQVKVIHGKGTGTLRKAAEKYLSGHPLVKSFRPGEYGEGGIGVTMVTLADK
ncbi:MAG: Smr/MutS family protein [Chloroflexi bacterium]|nr:Smr/MutS family protein [Chloroflexota bacterium]